MYFIVVKFPVKPESADRWMDIVADYTNACRAEEGNIFFDWSINTDDPSEFILIEAFEDDAAEAHVNSDHFRTMQQEFPRYLSATPQIVNGVIDADGWGPMAEITVS